MHTCACVHACVYIHFAIDPPASIEVGPAGFAPQPILKKLSTPRSKAGKRIAITVFNILLGILLFNHARKYSKKKNSVWKTSFSSSFVREWTVVI